MSRGFCIFLGLLLLVGGLALVAINGWTTWEQGAKWAVTEQGKLIIAITVVAIEVIGVVIVGFCGGAALGARRWVMGSLLTFMMLASAVVVVNSIASFQASERISSTKTNELALARAKEADKLQAASANKSMDLAGRAEGTRARRDFINANRDSIRDFRQLPTAVVAETDAGVRLWSYLSGYGIETVQLTQAGYTAILQILLSMVCIHASGVFLNWSPAKAEPAKPASAEPSRGGSSGSGGSGGGEPGKLKVVHSAEPASNSLVQRLNQAAPAPEPTSPRKPEPAKVSTADFRVPISGPPQRKLPFDQMVNHVRLDMAHGEPASTTRELAKRTGWSQSSVNRQQKKVKGKLEMKHKVQPRRVPGNGASLHYS